MKLLRLSQHLALRCVEPDLPVTWRHGLAVYRSVIDDQSGKVTAMKIIRSSGFGRAHTPTVLTRKPPNY